jgi:hypothetical protein
MGQLAIARRFLDMRAGRLDKIEDCFVIPGLARQIAAGYDDARTAMALGLMIKRKFHFRADLKWPFGEQTHTLRRPLDVLLDEID